MKYKARAKTIVRDGRIAGYIGVVLDEQKNVIAETPIYGLRGDAHKAAVVKAAALEAVGAVRH